MAEPDFGIAARAFVRLTNVHVRPAPVTLVTVVDAALTLSVETNASSSSLAAVVENAPDMSDVPSVDRPNVVVASMLSALAAAEAVNATPLTLAPLAIVTAWLDGVKVKPLFDGVTV